MLTGPWWWLLYSLYRFQIIMLSTWYLYNVIDQFYIKKISSITTNAFIWGPLKSSNSPLFFGSMQDIFNIFKNPLNNQQDRYCHFHVKRKKLSLLRVNRLSESDCLFVSLIVHFKISLRLHGLFSWECVKLLRC